jgi:hypothetical protein
MIGLRLMWMIYWNIEQVVDFVDEFQSMMEELFSFPLEELKN